MIISQIHPASFFKDHLSFVSISTLPSSSFYPRYHHRFSPSAPFSRYHQPYDPIHYEPLYNRSHSLPVLLRSSFWDDSSPVILDLTEEINTYESLTILHQKLVHLNLQKRMKLHDQPIHLYASFMNHTLKRDVYQSLLTLIQALQKNPDTTYHTYLQKFYLIKSMYVFHRNRIDQGG